MAVSVTLQRLDVAVAQGPPQAPGPQGVMQAPEAGPEANGAGVEQGTWQPWQSTWYTAGRGLVCLDVRAHRAGDGISRAGQRQTHLVHDGALAALVLRHRHALGDLLWHQGTRVRGGKW